MPSRAVTSFLPMESLGVNAVELARVNALSGCYLISTEEVKTGSLIVNEVSMPSRAVTSFLPRSILRDPVHYGVVSMPSRAVTSFLQDYAVAADIDKFKCQCPLGLLPHFYSTPSKT